MDLDKSNNDERLNAMAAEECLRIGILAIRNHSAVGPPPGAIIRSDLPRRGGMGTSLVCGRCMVGLTLLRNQDWTSVDALMENGTGPKLADCPTIS